MSQEELDAAAKNAGLDRVFAAHSDGWDTQVGMAGGYLSGGEQQRVAIARALVKNPDYLVLDEATANLDAESAHEIIFALKKLMEGRTTIMVAHNEELLQAADCVIRLDGGKVAGQE